LAIVWIFGRPRAQSAADDPSSAYEPPEDAELAIERANRACAAALESGDAHAYALQYAEDGVSLPGHAPAVRGRAAIEEKMLETLREHEFTGAEWRTLETRVNGKTAFETGAYKFHVRPYGAKHGQEQSGRYFIVWKRAGDGWKIVVDAAQPGAPSE